MKEITKNIFIESAYPGVTLGAINFKTGALLIDSPPRAEDAQSWRDSLQKAHIHANRLLVNLDSHPDRTIGTRSMGSNVISQEIAQQDFDARTSMFKAQNKQSGAEWETCSGLSGTRWLPPNISFSEQMVISMFGHEIILEHHPGPSAGAMWVDIPDKLVLFVGDSVTHRQPPFLSDAHIEDWISSLDLLLSKKYLKYKIISSRGGKVPEKSIHELKIFLADVNKKLAKLGKKKSDPAVTGRLVPKMLEKFSFAAAHRELYTNRLIYGLSHYYTRKYFPEPSKSK